MKATGKNHNVNATGKAEFGCTIVSMGPILHCGLFCLLMATSVLSSPSCSTEENVSKGMKETTCIQLGLTTVPLKEIPQDTAILNLSFNALQSISTSTFKGMKQMVELDLLNNSLTAFQADLALMLEDLNLAQNSLNTFPELSRLSRLTNLDLSNNQIATIPDSAFKGLGNLKILNLKKNKINSLPEQVFDSLDNLNLLDLSYNQLQQLPEHLISNLGHLEKFYLNGNKLKHVPEGFFDNPKNLLYVYLDDNPWVCNCDLIYFKDWVDENSFNIYKLVNEIPESDGGESVICDGGPPLLEYNTDHCSVGAQGDADKNMIPPWPTPKRVLPTTTTILPYRTTMITTVRETTAERIYTSVPTSIKTSTTPITSTKQLESTAPEVLTTSVTTTETTPSPPTTTSTMMTTPQLPKSTTPQLSIVTTAVMEVPTTTLTTLETTPLPSTATSTMTTTPQPPKRTTWEQATLKITEVQVSTVHPTSTLNPTTNANTEFSTWLTTNTTTTDFQDNSSYTLPPARDAPIAEARGMAWLENEILKNCCFLHLIIYIICIFLLLAQMIVSVLLLVWTYTRFFWHYQALTEKVPSIRLIRYSLRAPVNEDEILLVQNGAIEPHLRDQSSFGVTRMLVLEANSMVQERRYTSAIL
ncbi:platelet glycoprotein Ib alpha chain [Gastrophryne carolinensis]